MSEEDRWAAPRGLPRLSVGMLQRHHDTISEESQSQDSPRVSSERVKASRRTAVDPLNLALVSEQDSLIASLASPAEAEPRRRSPRQGTGPLLSQASSQSPKLEEGESLLSSEGLYSIPKRRREPDEGSFYAVTPKDTEQSSFDSHTLSQDDSSKKKLQQRLSIPKVTPTRSVDSMRSVAKQDDFMKEFAQFHATFSDEEIEHAFEELDLDQAGYLTGEKLRTVLDGIGEYVPDEVVDEMIRMLDAEGRGQVVFQEFYRMATGQSTAPIGGALPPNPTMKIVGMNQITWKRPGGSRTQRSGTNASLSESRVAGAQTPGAKPKPPTSAPRPLKSIETVQRPPKRVKHFAVSGRPPKPPTGSAVPTELPKPQLATPALSTLSPRDTDFHTIVTLESQVEDGRERNSLISELVHSTIFTSQTIERLVQIFVDVTGLEDGELDYNSFLAMVNSRLPPGGQLEDDRVTKRMFAILDVDKSQTLSVREFVTGLSSLRRPKDEEQFKFVYRVFDADDDGTISKNELIRILKLNTHSIHTDEQAQAKAEELLYLAGNPEFMTLEGFMKVREKKLMLLIPVQERARKMVYIANSEDR